MLNGKKVEGKRVTMQKKKIILKKIIATMIIFLLTLLDAMPILNNFSFAAENNENAVEVKSYFSSETVENAESLNCDVNEKNLKLNFEIKVNEKGYLKSGTLKFGDNLNFTIQENSDVKIKDNQIKVQALNETESQKISIPIGFVRKDSMTSTYISKSNQVTFSGIFVDNKGEEQKIEKRLNANLSWKEQTSTNLEYNVIKNINYEKDGVNGKILQVNAKISGKDQTNKLPIKNSELKIDIPQIEGLEISNIQVEANKLSYTEGREDSKIEFTDSNYRREGNVLYINVGNNEKDGAIFNSYGSDEYTITFSYTGENAEITTVNGNVEFTINNYAGNTENNKFEIAYDLTQAIGNIVQYMKEDKDEPISKGYLMANSQNEKYEITYTKKDILNISRSDLISSLEIVDTREYFTDEQNMYEYNIETASNYKSTEFSRENLVNILGESGYVQIYNGNDELIKEIKFEQDANEEGNYIVDYPNGVTKIKIITSGPVADGNISIISTKSIKKIDFVRDDIKTFAKLINASQAYITYNEGAIDDLGEAETVVSVNPTTSNATLEISQSELSSVSANEGVNFKIRLNNNEDTSDLYENPVFEIRLPQAIKEARIKNIDLFYANNELEIANVENLIDGDNQIIRISLKGSQTSYNINKETNGTLISFDVDLGVDEFAGNISEMIEMYYYNAIASKYNNESEWHMLLSSNDVSYGMNGYDGIQISYKAPEGLVTGQTSETKDETQENENIQNTENTSNKISSVKQGADTDLLEEGTEAKLATMDITVLNSTGKRYSNFRILGRLPFAGNKDITTGEDLGTTVDTILDTEITSSDEDLNYTVYYSENGEATEDLTDENNGWNTNYYKTGGVKSYLIVVDENHMLEPNDKLQFSYDYVIPADLKAGDAFYGTYATYYKEADTSVEENSSPNKIGYETLKNASIEIGMKLNGEKIKEISDAEYEITIKNTSDVDAKNLMITIPNVNGLTASYMKQDSDFTVEKQDTGFVIRKNNLQANSEEKITIGYNTFKIEEGLTELTISGNVSASNIAEQSFESEAVPVEKTNIVVSESGIYNEKWIGRETDCIFNMRNTSKEKLNNVVFTKQFSNKITVTNLSIDENKNADFTYDKNTGILRAKIDSMDPSETIFLRYTISLDNDDSLTGSSYNIKSKTSITSDDSSKNVEYENDVKFYMYDIQITPINKENSVFVSENNDVTYAYEVKNNCEIDVDTLTLNVETSSNFEVKSLTFIKDDGTEVFGNMELEDSKWLILKPGETAKLVFTGKIVPGISNSITATAKGRLYGKIFTAESVSSIVEDAIESQNYKLTGVAYVDANHNNQQDRYERVLSGIIVNLCNSETNEIVGSKITDISGRYIFDNVENGKYYVKFNYDEDQYELSSEDSEELTQNKASVMNIDGKNVTDNVSIEDKSVANVDLGLTDDNIFDLKLDTIVEKMTIQNSAENNEFASENGKLSKIDIDPDLVNGSKVLIEYKVTVENQGTISGKATKLVDYMPSDLEFDSSLNPDWYLGADGNLYTTALKDEAINPGETKEIKLILIKNMTEKNTGLIHNSIEIADAENDKGIADIDSTPGNKLAEDDLSYADSIVGITTGLRIGTLPIVLVSLVVLIPLAFLVWRFFEKRRYV